MFGFESVRNSPIGNNRNKFSIISRGLIIHENLLTLSNEKLNGEIVNMIENNVQ
tara:strand:- start:8195 stop:8356 length:162 start_codon:yes stop_codon:yes gene_type:complete